MRSCNTHAPVCKSCTEIRSFNVGEFNRSERRWNVMGRNGLSAPVLWLLSKYPVIDEGRIIMNVQKYTHNEPAGSIW